MVASDRLTDAQVTVVGAGVVGAAIAYRLAQAGASVTTVESRYPGSGTSGNSFAWLNGFNKPPRDYHRLNLMSIRDHEDLADELNAEWVHVNGGLHWADSADSQRSTRLREHVRHLREWGARVDVATPETVMRELEPDLSIDPTCVSEVYVVEREGWLDAVPMAHGVLHAAIRRYGARLERADVTGFRLQGGGVAAVCLSDGRELPTDLVIDAAGPEAGRVAALAGIEIPLDRPPGVLVGTAPAPICLRHVVVTPEVNVRPEGGGRVLLQRETLDGTVSEGDSLAADGPLARESMTYGQRVLPCLADVQASVVKVGVRSMPRDGYPIVGLAPGVSGFYLAVTHSGITLSARLARLVTEDLAGGTPWELAPYRPARFAVDA